MTTRQVAFLVILNVVLLPTVLLSSRIEKLNEDVWTIDLGGDCYLLYPRRRLGLSWRGLCAALAF